MQSNPGRRCGKSLGKAGCDRLQRTRTLLLRLSVVLLTTQPSSKLMSPKFFADVRISGMHSFVSLGRMLASTGPSFVHPSTQCLYHDMLRTRGIGQGGVRRARRHLKPASIARSVRRGTRTCWHRLCRGSYIEPLVSTFHYMILS